ncbi:hypothetical protein QBC32DRAFT_365742 [Pseudoneurospora amorphoporcata]|uniref:Zn(2)-C6 fungal-type domain-containing protein n=1 Tax=Pseudoneurospora amorphoporcata TaxID=241081 RepID=A0AAN6NKZ2_9PEZI|nr:hypothetical protein QBC32DRAFT_365742 [Pseudoneurospora amorphoporcata]
MALTFSHLTAATFEKDVGRGRKRPRVREAVSCEQCRTRKIRCDRETPCKPCKDRGHPSSCVYSSHKDRHHHQNPTSSPRSNKTKATTTKASSRSPPQTPSIEVVPPIQTHTPPESCSSSIRETPEPMLSIDRSLSPFSRLPSPLPSPRSPRFQISSSSSACKTRMIGLSHWMAPCNEMDVVRALLDHSEPFNASRKAFHELKTMLRLHNAIPPTLPNTLSNDTDLKLLLPDRITCDRWCAQFQATYGRIYTILDPKALTTDVDRIYAGTLSHPVHVSKVLLAMAIAMQLSSSDRLYGRSLARQVEIFLHSSSRFQKPCIGVVQVHLLLIVLKTISASDTDKTYDLMGLQGITTQIVLNMGLHRDPGLFADVSPYHAEVRKRLWWCFVRLNLEYCVRSGTQCSLRLAEEEGDCDCPLPTTADLGGPEGDGIATSNAILSCKADEQTSADLAFGIAAAKLARVIGPMQQALYSSKASDPAQMQNELRAAYEEMVAELPTSLQPGTGSHTSPADPIQALQQSVLSSTLHSFLTIINLASTLSCPAHGSQRTSLMEIWDSSTSVFHEFQSLYQSRIPSDMDIPSMAGHLLWTDACRAVLAACWTVSRLRELDNSSHPQRTVHVLQQILTEALGFMSGMWKAKFHLGPIAAKTSIILAVTLNVTLNSSKSNKLDQQQALMDVGVATAENLVAELTQALQLRQMDMEGQEPHSQQTRGIKIPTRPPLPDMGLGIMTSCYSPPSVVSASLSSPDMESISVTGTGSIYGGSWTAPTPSNTLLVPPRNSSGASSMVGTPSLTTHEYFDLDFSGAESAFDIGLPQQQSACAYGDYQLVDVGGSSMQQSQGGGLMYNLNAYQGMEGMNGMSLWQ